MSERTERHDPPINVYDYLNKGDVFIQPAHLPGRTQSVTGWAVVRVGYKTNPNAAWYEYGNKVFSAFSGGGRKAALEAAQKWAEERYGVRGPWKRNGHGDYLPDGFYRPLRREVEAAAARKAKKAAKAVTP